MARVNPPPAEIAFHVLDPIWIGTRLLVVVPLPKAPTALLPHAQRVPSARSPTECAFPPATARQLVAEPIWTGRCRSVVVPSPSWPSLFSPHAHNVPSERTASVCQVVAAMADQSEPSRFG